MPSSQKDSKFEEYYNGLNGKKPLGAYYYAYAYEICEGKKEAENCLKYFGGKNFDLPIFYDLEDSSMHYINEVAREFVDTIKNAGYKAGIYCNGYWARTKVDLSKFTDCTIWIAQYGTNNGKVPSDKPNVDYSIWQYTSVGKINGISGNVDMNIAEDDVITNNNSNTDNDTIKSIQNWLNSDYNVNLKVDGYYGELTNKALIKALQHELNIQYDKNLDEDSLFGPLTKQACINVKQGAKGNITKLIQSELYCKGYNPNRIDGLFGNGTTKAVKEFQEANNLSVDGIVGKNTFEKLFSYK